MSERFHAGDSCAEHWQELFIVAGFDTRLRSWVSAAELAHPATALAEDFPIFDGVLLLDDASRAAAADDFGHLVHRQPLAVLRPVQ
jgi:hypothetical protein